MDISLWYFLSNSRVGVGSYTANLYHSLVKLGHDVEVYKIKGPLSNKPDKDSKLRNFGYDIKWQLISLESAIEVMKRTVGIIAASVLKGFFIDNRKAIETLISMGCHVVVHDKFNVEGDYKDILGMLEKYKSVPIVSRRSGISMMKDKGFDAVFLSSPYVQLKSLEERYNASRVTHAISLSRFEHWKNPHWSILANENLPDNLKIHLWGDYQKSFMKKEIIGKYKGWDDEKNFTGPMYPKEHQKFPAERGFAVNLANNSSFLTDMSSLKGDGGGIQYTLLEAMDGGAIPILNTGWTNVPNSIVNHNVNCISVGSPKELQDILEESHWEDCLDIIDANCDLLDTLSPEVMVPKYVKFLKEHGRN